jgi:hypothetical protein
VKCKSKNKNSFLPLLLFAISATVLSLWPNLSWCGGIGSLERRLTILEMMQNLSRRERELTLRFVAAATIWEAAHDISASKGLGRCFP